MIRSMTGYARAEQQGPWGRLNWELRSVNHRYLDVQFKLPEDFRAIENELRAQATAQIGRGKVEIGLRYQRVDAGDAPLNVDAQRLTAVIAALNLVGQQTRTLSAPDPVRILSFPGVVRTEAVEAALPLAEAQASFSVALADFAAMREREGERLGVYLAERLDALSTLVASVRVRAPEVRDAWLERLRNKVRELGVDVDPARLAQEAALAAQRLDVDEELSRLDSHIVEIRGTLTRGEAVGRRLDFLMQELNREANTLSSKSQDAEMTRCAVEMKVCIEQMREQVQNLE
jgi:uncharacterized protein (TIGR00255 family)